MTFSFGTSEEKREAIAAIGRVQRSLQRSLESIADKRSWSPAQKAMGIAECQKDIDILETINRGLCFVPVIEVKAES